MWGSGICGSAVGGWFWIFPLACMTFWIALIFIWRKRRAMMGARPMTQEHWVDTGRHAGDAVENTLGRRSTALKVGREAPKQIVSDSAQQ